MKWILPIVLVFLTVGCGRSGKKEETPTRGHAVIWVDETVYPLIRGAANVFENQYRYAQLDIIAAPEVQISEALKNDSIRLAVLSRSLTPAEEAHFEAKTIVPRLTEIASDGIALIINSQNADTVIRTDQLRAMLRGDDLSRTLVFDHPESGIVRYMAEFADTDTLKGVYSFRSHTDVLEYVAENPGAIGFVGVNWLYEPDSLHRPNIDRIRLLAVGNETGDYFKPTQEDIAAGDYPFVRKIWFVNVQGSAGLGLGFATFLAGDVGQRIVLKSGLAPVTYPKREVVVRKQL